MTRTRNALIAAVFAAPALFAVPAAADTDVEFTTDIVIDATAPRPEILASVERQARQACTYTQPLTRTELVDNSCVVAIVDQISVRLAENATNRDFAEADAASAE